MAVKLKHEKSIIFDFDNTLVMNHHSTDKAIMNLVKKDYPELKNGDLLRMIQGMASDYEICLKFFSGKRLKEVYNEIIDVNLNHVRTMEFDKNIPKILEKLSKKYNLFIVSGREITSLNYFLEKEDWKKYFIEIVGAGPKTKGKPDPESMNYLYKKYSLLPEFCVYVGDKDQDFIFAVNSGCKFLASLWYENIFTRKKEVLCKKAIDLPLKIKKVFENENLEKSKKDKNVPKYHPHFPDSWINDPIPFYHNGKYHLFFQYSPGRDWGLRHWGHVVSKDLVNWENLPIALSPSEDGSDKDGVFTGSIIYDKSDKKFPFKIFYTGVRPQVQCLAKSRDLVNWEKQDKPLIKQKDKPRGFGPCFRDPNVWKEEGIWNMALGSQKGKSGAVLLYKSKDMIDWNYFDSVIIDKNAICGWEYECPDLFKIGKTWVLLSSCEDSRGDFTYWQTGEMKNGKFISKNNGILDYGRFYAGKTTLKGSKRIVWGWIMEDRNKKEQKIAGWSGSLSLPRELFILPSGKLGMKISSNFKKNEKKVFSLKTKLEKRYDKIKFSKKLNSNCFKLKIEANPKDTKNFKLKIKDKEIFCDLSKNYFNNNKIDLSKKVNLEIYVDHSIIEIFLNDEYCETLRSYSNEKDIFIKGVGKNINLEFSKIKV